MAVDQYKLNSFFGGLRLPGHKQLSNGEPIAPARLAERLVLPLQQHIGEPAEPHVAVGERVRKGQMIARPSGYVSAALHAPSSGTVVDIGEHMVPHPSGLAAPCVVIETDGADEWIGRPREPVAYEQLDPGALRNRIRDAGIVGLGGAGFPSSVKLNPGRRRGVDYLVLNGAECEPYITCDEMLMRERARQIVGGLRIMRHALQTARCVIGIEDNKPQAYAALVEAVGEDCGTDIQVVQVPTIYPAGGERQLIKVLTGREVPSHGLPLDVGVVCHNVGTASAVYDALRHSQPLLSRVVTVTGGGVRAPRNLEVLIGTPLRELIEQCGGYTERANRLIIGGPMMGFTVTSDELPVIKTTNCVLVTDARETPDPEPALPCIRCGACAEVCPARLLPQQLYWYSRCKDFDKTQDYHLFDCIECGCCAYVCPSRIPLVQYFRFAKTEIWAQEREKQKADLARRRHEFHIERLEREKREREERMHKKKTALKAAASQAEQDPKKTAIEAALKRVEAKKAQAKVTPRNVDNLTEAQRREIAEVEERRKRRMQQEGAPARIDSDRKN